jgi:surface antigen
MRDLFGSQRTPSIRWSVRALGAIGLCASLLVGTQFTAPIAATADTGGYPWASAPCEWGSAGGATCTNPGHSTDAYDWYWDENGSGGYSGAGELYDQWGYGYRNCTSYLAWKVSQNAYGMPHGIGNANNWDDYFSSHGVTVNGTPAVGAIAQTDAGSFGHVAYVESFGGGNVTVSEYNHDTHGNYDTRTVSATTFRYIHVKDLAGGTPPPPTPRESDFNGDGKSDIVSYEGWNGSFHVGVSSGSAFGWNSWLSGIGTPTAFGSGDFNGDGKTDIVSYEAFNNSFHVGLSNGSSFNWGTWLTGIGIPTAFSTGDFNGDGKTDIVSYEAFNGAFHVGISSGSAFGWNSWLTGIGTPTAFGTGDFNGDGKTDIVSYEAFNGAFHVGISSGSAFGWNSWLTGIGTPTAFAAGSQSGVLGMVTTTLSVSTAGSGSGSASGAGISCPGTCTKAYPPGTQVTLTAAPANGSTFTGWSGACTGTSSCTLTMNRDNAVTATFTAAATPTVHCVVPRLHGMTLRHAKRALSHANCQLGTVRRPAYHAHRLHVAHQSASANTVHRHDYPVNVRLR